MKNITVNELKSRLDKGEVFLIDVREPLEHKTQSIEGAVLVPLGEVSLEKLPSTDKPIVFHCRSGKRSLDACRKILEQNPNLEVFSLEGGILAWEQAGFGVKKSRMASVSLERQALLLAGLLVFLGTILGALINSGFYLVTGLIGIDLISAGLTGWFSLAKLLSIMPWNH